MTGLATVRVASEHLAAVRRAIQSLDAERSVLERWGASSVELALAIDDLHELEERMRAELAVGTREPRRLRVTLTRGSVRVDSGDAA